MGFKNIMVAPGAASNTDILTCPASKEIVISSITICNRSATATTVRIALRPLGAVIANGHYFFYDTLIRGNDTIIFTGGITMIATDIITVYNTLATVSFNIFYQEI